VVANHGGAQQIKKYTSKQYAGKYMAEISNLIWANEGPRLQQGRVEYSFPFLSPSSFPSHPFLAVRQ